MIGQIWLVRMFLLRLLFSGSMFFDECSNLIHRPIGLALLKYLLEPLLT